METVFKRSAANLKEKIDYLDRCYLKGRTGPAEKEFPGIVDDYFCECFGSSAAGPEIGILTNPYAIIALGGYGRGEFWSLPDLDLLFLFSRDVPEGAAALIREAVYPLWDMGWNVNYSLQTAAEMAKLARKGFRTLSSLFDARFVCGVSTVYSDLSAYLRNSFYLHKSRSIGLTLVRNRETRTLAHAGAEYLREPDLLKGPGGLMDLREMLWIARLRFNIREMEDLKYSGILSHEEVLRLMAAVKYLGGVRKHLCHVGGKRLSRLYDDLQEKVGEGLEIMPPSGLTPREGLLTAVSGWMSLVERFRNELVHEAGLSDSKPAEGAGASTHYRWISVKKGRLAFSSSLKILGDPELLMKIFEERCRLKVPLGGEAKRLVGAFAGLVCPIPEKLTPLLPLHGESCPVLAEMLETGLLQRFIPGFAAAENRVHLGSGSSLPLHLRLLGTLTEVNRMSENRDGSQGDLFTGLRFRNVLLWAALLQGIGRADGSANHVKGSLDAATALFSEREPAGCRASFTELCFLIEKQGCLRRLATRRDIRDPSVVRDAAKRLGTGDRLKMLYILDTADLTAAGTANADLGLPERIKELFLRITGVVEDSEAGLGGDGPGILQEQLAEGISPAEKETANRIAEHVVEGYLPELSRDFLLAHMALHDRRNESEKACFHWEINGGRAPGTRRVVVGARGGEEVLTVVAGALHHGGIEIIRAGVYPLGNGIRILVIRAREPVDRIFEAERWKIAELHICNALSGKPSKEVSPARRAFFREKVAGIEITVDNNAAVDFSVVEILTDKGAEILFRASCFMLRANLETGFVLSGTEEGKRVCVLYVRDPKQGKLSSGKEIEAFRGALENFLKNQGDKDPLPRPEGEERRRFPRAG